MNELKRNLIFNPTGNDDLASRTIIHGNTTGLFQLNSTKYAWAKSLYQVMQGNFWLPEKVSGLSDDAITYKALNEGEKRAYNGILSFLIFLDSIQTVNLPNFSEYITAPEINLILAVQSYQESTHSYSYQTILESVVPAEHRDKIYYFWRDDKHLLQRNQFIGQIYQDFIDNPNDKTFFKGVIANFLLESIYFYNGFAFFDTLADQNKMLATDRMINYIRKDELTHVTLFANIIREIEKEFPEVYDKQMIYDMMAVAVEQEINWSKHIIANSVIGMSDQNIEDYTRWLANNRLNLLGLTPLYKGYDKNPYKHLDRMQDNNSEKGNFFESTVTNYTQSSSMKGSWDF